MSQLTSHVLDTSKGLPAKDVRVVLYREDSSLWIELANAKTDEDGRIKEWRPLQKLSNGIYKLAFDTKAYFKAEGVKTFYPTVEIIFEIKTRKHYHVPLLLNPFGYTTYRGS
jgi:5-hydroxyisourate hydrolase